MTRVPGAVDLTPADFDIWLQRLAEPLGVIHAVSADDFGWQFFAYNDVDRLSVPGWSRVPDLWARANAVVRGPAPDTPVGFIHRDYHPVNVLWQNGKISGIVDWPNACRGPIGADLGHCRLNLAAMYGVNAADSFLRAYESLTGVGQHPYWDLRMLTDDWQPELEVYTPWAHFGLHHITTRLMGQRLDDYLIRIMARL
jgi:aminoglycoside phosphotransferase (APT) family kinase protein